MISNFIEKAKDQMQAGPVKFAYFKDVVDQIKRLSEAKNYYDTDLSNIEDALSILEMRSTLGIDSNHDALERFIKAVILYHTPPITPYSGDLPSNWREFIFGNNYHQQVYGHFVSHLLGLRFEENSTATNRIHVDQDIERQATRYDVVSMNYDLILENYAEFVNKTYSPSRPIAFAKSLAQSGAASGTSMLLKLHGSADSARIVVPTWNKDLHKENVETWKLAHDVIRRANEIRFIGYSLPVGDGYVRHFLRAASIDSDHLRRIDVLCYDPAGDVAKRYESFVDRKLLRFRNARTESYLGLQLEKGRPWMSNRGDLDGQLEVAHREFFGL